MRFIPLEGSGFLRLAIAPVACYTIINVITQHLLTK
jgi:hypothetical protein